MVHNITVSQYYCHFHQIIQKHWWALEASLQNLKYLSDPKFLSGNNTSEPWSIGNKQNINNHLSWSQKKWYFCCIANNSHATLPPRPRGYVKRLTPWAASTCQRTAQSWRTCAHWCECARSRPRCASRGAFLSCVASHVHVTAIIAQTY